MEKKKLTAALIVILAAISLLFIIFNNKEETPEEIKLIIASDLHYISPRLTDNGEYFHRMVENADGKYMFFCEEIVDAFADEVISEAPSALILTGDLTFNGAAMSHEDLMRKLLKIKQAGISVFVLPGNHDLNNKMAASFHENSYTLAENINDKDFAEIYREFGYEQAQQRDPDSLSYVAEIAPDLWFLFVDVNSAHPKNRISDCTFNWIEKQLQTASEKNIRVISFTHQNLLQHNSLFFEGFVIENHSQLKALYQKYDVRLNVSGHMHMQHIKTEGDLHEIASSSLMLSPHQFGIMTISDESVEYHTKAADVFKWADKNQLSGFESFSRKSHDFFWENSYRQCYEAFKGMEDAQAVSEFAADLNCAYFSGIVDAVDWDEQLLEKITESSSMFADYIQSIAEERGKNHQSFKISLK